MTTTPAELEDIIKQIDLPQRTIALMCGMNDQTLSRMRHGHKEIQPRTVLHLAALARLSQGHRNEILKLARALKGERPPYEVTS